MEDLVANFFIIFGPHASWSRSSQEYVDIYCTCRPKKQLKFFGVIKALLCENDIDSNLLSPEQRCQHVNPSAWDAGGEQHSG